MTEHSLEDNEMLKGIIDRMLKTTEQASQAIDDAIVFVDQSNKRIAVMEENKEGGLDMDDPAENHRNLSSGARRHEFAGLRDKDVTPSLPAHHTRQARRVWLHCDKAAACSACCRFSVQRNPATLSCWRRRTISSYFLQN